MHQKGPQRWLQKRLGRRLEEVAKAVGGGYCRLQMPWKLAFGVRETEAGHRLGALEGGGGWRPPTTRRNVTQGGVRPPLPMHPCPPRRGGGGWTPEPLASGPPHIVPEEHLPNVGGRAGPAPHPKSLIPPPPKRWELRNMRPMGGRRPAEGGRGGARVRQRPANEH